MQHWSKVFSFGQGDILNLKTAFIQIIIPSSSIWQLLLFNFAIEHAMHVNLPYMMLQICIIGACAHPTTTPKRSSKRMRYSVHVYIRRNLSVSDNSNAKTRLRRISRQFNIVFTNKRKPKVTAFSLMTTRQPDDIINIRNRFAPRRSQCVCDRASHFCPHTQADANK